MLREIIYHLKRTIDKSYQDAQTRIVGIGLVGAIGFPLYFYIWKYVYPQPYESLELRLIGAALFIGLIYIHKWPDCLAKYRQWYWILTIIYALPFFFSYMLLMNGVTVVWLMSALVALFLLMMILDWRSVILVSAAGHGFAWAAYWAVGGDMAAGAHFAEFVPIFIFTIVAGGIFDYHTSLVDVERKKAMLSVVSYIAHELRTPLLSIKSGASGVKRYFPTLVSSYRIARDSGADVEKIRESHISALETVLDDIEEETSYSNAIIDILLMNAGGRISKEKWDSHDFSVREMVQEAIDRYPFKDQSERALVSFECREDFRMEGSKLLMVHVIFNMIKNALYSISKKGSGSIAISIASDENNSYLSVRDTGSGIKKEDVPHVFDSFYTSKLNGTGAGMGLAFCNDVIEALGGHIEVSSTYGAYAEFTMKFRGLC